MRGLCLGFQNDKREEEVRQKTVANLHESVATESIDFAFLRVGGGERLLGLQKDKQEEEVR